MPNTMSQDQSVNRAIRWLRPRSSPIATVACMIGAIFGVAVNLRMAKWGLGENVFGFVVWLSIGMIALGFLPGIRKWCRARMATLVTCIAIGFHITYSLWTVVTYKETEQGGGGQPATRSESKLAP